MVKIFIARDIAGSDLLMDLSVSRLMKMP